MNRKTTSNMEWPQELLELFKDPILDGVRPKAAPITPDDRRVKILIEITEWVEANNGRLPKLQGDFKEKRMARSLAALRRDATVELIAYDKINLLREE